MSKSTKVASEKKADLEKQALHDRIAELEELVAAQQAKIAELEGVKPKKAKKGKKADAFGREIAKTKRSKFKCATSGKHSCDACGKEIERGDTIRFVDVKYADGTKERYTFCCGKHRNAYCDSNGIPQD